MGLIITTALILLLSIAGMVAVFVVTKRAFGGGSAAEHLKTVATINAAEQEIHALLKSKDSFIGGGQYQFVQNKRDEVSNEIDKERENLRQIEEKLDSAQKLVEEKEAQQQEIKAAKESDIVKLQELSVNFEDYNRETMELEQKLAQSLKNLDSVMSELQMTQAQREAFGHLQVAVEEAGARVRDLLIEYQSVHERLTMLNQQHSELEEEYTRLVEQQLGE